MPRQAKWVAAGVYQPTYQPRHAYGRRRWGYELLEEFLRSPCDVLDAQTVARYRGTLGGQISTVVAVPMPRGGVRYLLVCPRCHKRATRLYGRYHPMYRQLMHACRTCWGLCYASQYAGRRIEAHPDYLQAVMRRQIAQTPRESRGHLPVPVRRQMARIRHILRMGRYQRAHDLLCQRTYRHLERREIATDLALMILTAQSMAWQRRSWQTILNRVLWPGHRADIPTLRHLLASDDTPRWAHTVLQEALERAEKGEKLPKDARKAIKTAAETDTKGHFAAIIEQAQLDALRTRYAALGQGRRARRAA